MALHTTLPIYKAAYDLLDVAVEITRHMPRDFRASIGTTIAAKQAKNERRTWPDWRTVPAGKAIEHDRRSEA